jgi:hypothetical protein
MTILVTALAACGGLTTTSGGGTPGPTVDASATDGSAAGSAGASGSGGTAGTAGSSGASSGAGGADPCAGSTQLVLATPPGAIVDFAVDGAEIFYAAAAPTAHVARVSTVTGTSTVLLVDTLAVQVAVDATTVFVRRDDGSVVTVARDGGPPTAFAGTGIAMALLGDHVVLAPGDTTLAFWPKTGGAAPIVGKAFQTPHALFAGDTAVAFAGGDGLTTGSKCAQVLQDMYLDPTGATGTDPIVSEVTPAPMQQCDPHSVTTLIAATGNRGCFVDGVSLRVACNVLVGNSYQSLTHAGPFAGIPRALVIDAANAYAITETEGACRWIERAPIGDSQMSTPTMLATASPGTSLLAISATHIYFAAADGIRRIEK